ncbi:unnamed protein product [Brassica oleracea var. botrytis]
MKEVMKKHGIEYERFVYNNDMVTRVPFDDKILFGYKHYGSCNYFNSLYKGKGFAPGRDRFATGLGSDGDTASSGFTARMWSDGSYAEEVRLALLVYGGGSLPVLVGCYDESGGVIFVLDVSLSASVFLAVLRRALVVLINTVANLETLYAGGMIHVSATVRVVSVGGFDRRPGGCSSRSGVSLREFGL